MPPLNTLNRTALTLAITQAVAMSSANAATIRVDNFTDENGSGCTLRQAIVSANTRTDTGNCVRENDDNNNEEILFENTEAVTISLTGPLPGITADVSIIGGIGGVTLDASGTGSRILNINNVNNPQTVLIENMTLTGADVTDLFGAGLIINRRASVTISNSTITGNSTNLLGGGVAVLGNSTLTVVDSTISNNTVTIAGTRGGYTAFRGGGIYNQAGSTLEIMRSTVMGNNASSGGGIFNNGDANIMDSGLSGNASSIAGGGIFNDGEASITITNSTVMGNEANSGGGIFNNGDVTITSSTLSGNYASNLGGGILNSDDATITNSTFSENTADRGGGIYNRETADITNSTLSGNNANNVGGGIFNLETAIITNSIVSGNTTDDSIAGQELRNQRYITLSNSVIGSSALNDAQAFGGTVAGGTVTISETIFAVSNVENVPLNQIIGPLRDNGGPTQTHALVFGSPAIDAAKGEDCPDTDQRGETRDNQCDIGAFEIVEEESFFVVPLPNGKAVIFGL